MLALFCLRLAWGMIASLLLLSPAQINPRFYRTHFLVVLGLGGGAAVWLRETTDIWFWVALSSALVLAFLGSLSWFLEGAPGGRSLMVGTTLALTAALCLADNVGTPAGAWAWRLAADFTSAGLLGVATTAMLMGHSYLLAPSMSIQPLMRLLTALLAAICLRLLVSGTGLWLWSWTSGHSLLNLKDETVLWLPVRWGVGFIAPFVLGWMAWQTAKIRSTQSATGILYVAVIFCFLGELTGQLLFSNTGFAL